VPDWRQRVIDPGQDISRSADGNAQGNGIGLAAIQRRTLKSSGFPSGTESTMERSTGSRVTNHGARQSRLRSIPMIDRERHRSGRIGWLRAAVLGANDGVVSTASLVIGVAAGRATRSEVLLAGIAGMAAGALSMAAGEYVSVSSQADTERADVELERRELAQQPEAEHRELAAIYVRRGVKPALALQVADQLMAHDAVAAHMRDELGISEIVVARPLQAALSSAAAFAVGAALPILTITFAPVNHLSLSVASASLISLVALGGLAARAGGASPVVGAARVAFWGAIAMGVTAGVGRMFGSLS
jgi:vacuolar iron transporter family protein